MKKIILAAMVSTISGASFMAPAAMAQTDILDGLQGKIVDGQTCVLMDSGERDCWVKAEDTDIVIVPE